MDFRPTIAPPGRLVRLGVVLDTRNAPVRVRELARMCDRAGIDAIWARDSLLAPDGEPRVEAWTALTMAANETNRVRVGAVLNTSFRPPGVAAAMAATLDAAIGGRVELTLSPGWLEAEHLSFGLPFPDTHIRTDRLESYASVVRRLLAGEVVSATGPFELEQAELGVASPQPGGPPVAVEAVGQPQIEVAARIADDVVVPAGSVRDVDGAVALIRRTAAAAGRDPATLGISLELPVSVGRTAAEAQARADSEPLFDFVGRPERVGIFGTLERCQDRVIQFAHAGVTDIRCVLPNSSDVLDVIAQLTAMVVGSVELLAPGTPRSKAPDPPQGWGGRSNRQRDG
jgi:alkanesulfonate monooxygenase SsuD/methylene tetrahydromethanopterin reductase-like flavin-dependent oxidoreductase (luciferase family)